MDLSSIISMDDLSPRQREMAEVIGLEQYIALTRHFGGENPYIPKFDELLIDPRNRELRSRTSGS